MPLLDQVIEWNLCAIKAKSVRFCGPIKQEAKSMTSRKGYIYIFGHRCAYT